MEKVTYVGVVYVSKSQWEALEKNEILAGDLMLHKKVGKKSDWMEGSFPPVKVEVSLREVK